MNEGDAPSMTSYHPYLLRAMYEWISDNGMTPQLMVDARWPGVRVPAFAVSDGRVVLNIAQRAVVGLEMGNDIISFSARFGGVSHPVSIPVDAVRGIYARETAQGVSMQESVRDADASDDGAARGQGVAQAEDASPAPKPNHLRVVK